MVLRAAHLERGDRAAKPCRNGFGVQALLDQRRDAGEYFLRQNSMSHFGSCADDNGGVFSAFATRWVTIVYAEYVVRGRSDHLRILAKLYVISRQSDLKMQTPVADQASAVSDMCSTQAHVR